MTQFKNECQNVPPSPPSLLYEMAAEYHQRCDEFDETVSPNGVPRDGWEHRIMNRHATAVREELFERLPHDQQRNLQREIVNYHS